MTPTPKKPKVVLNLDSDMENKVNTENRTIPTYAILMKNHTVLLYKWNDLRHTLNEVTAIIALPLGVDPTSVSIKLCDSQALNEVC